MPKFNIQEKQFQTGEISRARLKYRIVYQSSFKSFTESDLKICNHHAERESQPYHLLQGRPPILVPKFVHGSSKQKEGKGLNVEENEELSEISEVWNIDTGL